jgi:integrase
MAVERCTRWPKPMGTTMGRRRTKSTKRRVRTHKRDSNSKKRTAARGIGQLRATYKSFRPGLYGDGGNLYLQVTDGANGRCRSWIFRYQLKGSQRRRDMGLGSLDDVMLVDARETARKYRLLVRDGIDPITDRAARVAKNLAASTAVMTFQQAAETYITQHRAGWKNPVHAAQWPSSLEAYAYPTLARMSVSDIETAHVMQVLKPIWKDKVQTATKVRGRIEAILGWATASGYRKDDSGHDRPNPARWRGHLDKLLAAPEMIKPTIHQKALPYDEVPAFAAELRKRKGVAALALEFTILTAVRTSDVLTARWQDIDRADRMWVIPQMSKTHKEHRVPLSTAAFAVLDKIETMTRGIGGVVGQSEFVFPNDVSGDALSENAMLSVINRMGRKGAMTTHGCRSSFRDWALEQTNFPWELAEISLGHKVGTKTERANARGKAVAKRVAIMQSWANFIAKPKASGKVIPMARTL